MIASSYLPHYIAELLVCPSSLGAAFVWDYRSGKLLNVLVDPGDSAMLAAAARPGLMEIATTSRDSVVRVWSPEVRWRRSTVGWRAVMFPCFPRSMVFEPRGC